jgi:hypothetical protein
MPDTMSFSIYTFGSTMGLSILILLIIVDYLSACYDFLRAVVKPLGPYFSDNKFIFHREETGIRTETA